VLASALLAEGIPEFAELPIRDDVRPLVLKQNAARLLGLAR